MDEPNLIHYDKTKGLTRTDAVRLHRHMWGWIADQTRDGKIKDLADAKTEYFKAMGIPVLERPSNQCFCCEYDRQYADNCQNCPIRWPNGGHCTNSDSPYAKFKDCAKDDTLPLQVKLQKTAALAREIAELPESER